MALEGEFTKHSSAVLDYTVEWGRSLAEGDALSTQSFTAPSGLTIEQISRGTDSTTIWLSGGTPGATYTVHNTVRTAGGRRMVETFRVYVRE